MHGRWLLFWIASAQVAGAQSATAASAAIPILVTANFSGDQFVPGATAITLSFTRLPSPEEGILAVVVGTADLTALFDRRDTRLVYQPQIAPLPSGEHDVVVYLAARDTWSEIARLPLKVLTPRGFTRSTVAPTATMSNKGQLVERGTIPAAPDARPTFQDFQLAAGLQTAQQRGPWLFETQLNTLGVTNRREALRFGELATEAPPVDLANYLVTVKRGPGSIALGHVTLNPNRHLVNAFASRGAMITLGVPAVSVSLGALGGPAEVGWDHPLGFTRSGHRTSMATLNIELQPARPGALHLDVSAIDGSLLPRSGFTRAALTDAERSSGYGVQLAASTPSQRLRITTGIAQSRFVNTRDPLLEGDGPSTPVAPARRMARYLETNVALFQNVRLGVLPASSMATGWRHERIEPLYRSVAAPVRADVLSNALDLNGTIGPLAIQASHARSNDNLDRLPSLLRTLTRVTTSQISLPLAAFNHGAAWPTLSYALQRTHQFGDGVPQRAGFTERDIPNDVAMTHDLGIQWQGTRWRGGYRLNRISQDTRQMGRDTVDRLALTHMVTLARVVTQSLDIGIDGSLEQQENKEVGQETKLERIGLTTNWRPTNLTSLNSTVTLAFGHDAPRTHRDNSVDLRAELAQAIPFGRPSSEGPRAQVFLRYARQSAVTRLFDPFVSEPRTSMGSWTLASGLNVKLF